VIIKLIAKLLARPAVANWIIKRAMRTPDEHLPGYMERYWLFNKYDRDTRKPKYPRIPFSIRVHHILREDHGRDHHDHPWNARTIILRGGYIEHRGVDGVFGRIPGDTATLKFGEFHRISYVTLLGVWTIFIMGRYRGRWGFLVDGQKVDYRDYLNK
jgi:hypothetical protein